MGREELHILLLLCHLDSSKLINYIYMFVCICVWVHLLSHFSHVWLFVRPYGRKADLSSSSPVWEQPGSENAPPSVLWHVHYQCVFTSNTGNLRVLLSLGYSLHLGFHCAPGYGLFIFLFTKKLKLQNYLYQCLKDLLGVNNLRRLEFIFLVLQNCPPTLDNRSW